MKKSELRKIIRNILQEETDIAGALVPQPIDASPFNISDANNFHLLPDSERREIINRIKQGTLDGYQPITNK